MRTTRLARARGRETGKERASERYSRASDSPRASTCSTCPTFQDLLSRTPDPRVRALARARAHTTRAHVRSMGPYPWSISFLLTRKRTTTFTRPRRAPRRGARSLLVIPPGRFILVYLIGIREVCSGLVGK